MLGGRGGSARLRLFRVFLTIASVLLGAGIFALAVGATAFSVTHTAAGKAQLDLEKELRSSASAWQRAFLPTVQHSAFFGRTVWAFDWDGVRLEPQDAKPVELQRIVRCGGAE